MLKLTRFKGDVSRIAVIVCSSVIKYAASGTQVRRFFIATFRDINGVVKKFNGVYGVQKPAWFADDVPVRITESVFTVFFPPLHHISWTCSGSPRPPPAGSRRILQE